MHKGTCHGHGQQQRITAVVARIRSGTTRVVAQRREKQQGISGSSSIRERVAVVAVAATSSRASGGNGISSPSSNGDGTTSTTKRRGAQPRHNQRSPYSTIHNYIGLYMKKLHAVAI